MLLRLFDHVAWADARVLQRIEAGDAPTSALPLFSHLLAAERVWLARLRGEDTSKLEIWPELSPAACAELAARLRVEFGDLLSSLTEESLSRPVIYRNSAGREFSTQAVDILVHLALHGAYHRGQIATRTRDARGEPVNTDYITFVREVPPIPFPEVPG